MFAVVERDDVAEVVNVGRPAALVAFGDKFGKMSPETFREVAWLTYRATVGPVTNDAALDEWLEALDELTMNDDEVQRVRAKLAGQLGPVELLTAATAAELLELAATPPTASSATGPTSKLDELLADARAELDRLAAEQLERERQAAEAEPVPPVPTTPTPATTGGDA